MVVGVILDMNGMDGDGGTGIRSFSWGGFMAFSFDFRSLIFERWAVVIVGG
jgi:hypothetical protein